MGTFRCKVDGFDELEKSLKQLGENEIIKLEKKALSTAAPIIKDEIYDALTTFKDLGYTRDELTVGTPIKDNYGVRVRIGWQGPHERYRLVHLNEFGYSKNGKTYKPRGLGKIQKAYITTEPKFIEKVTNTLREEISNE